MCNLMLVLVDIPEEVAFDAPCFTDLLFDLEICRQ